MSWWNAKYKNDHDEYEITFGSKYKEKTKIVEKVCKWIIDKLVQSEDDIAIVRHGRWIDGAENFTCGNHNAECSVCHCNISWSGCDEDFNYCPHCGAKMQ